MALDFPSAPVHGQVYDNFYYDSATAAWRSLGSTTNPIPSTLKDITVANTSVAKVPITVQGLASQSANLQEWKSSSGTVVGSIGPSGYASLPNGLLTGGQLFTGITYNGISAPSGQTGSVSLAVRANPSQTAAMQQWLDSSGAMVAQVAVDGRMYAMSKTGALTTSTIESGAFTAKGDASNAAAISFHQPGVAATNLGIDTNGIFKIGGFSYPSGSLSIDTGGRVTAPSNPAFSATRSGTYTYNAGPQTNAVVFNNVIKNVGSAYNSSTGKFTAPVAGNYLFYAGGYTSVACEQVWFIVNNSRTISLGIVPSSATIVGTGIVFLNAGDTVGVTFWGGGNASMSVYENGNHTFFQGMLMN